MYISIYVLMYISIYVLMYISIYVRNHSACRMFIRSELNSGGKRKCDDLFNHSASIENVQLQA